MQATSYVNDLEGGAQRSSMLHYFSLLRAWMSKEEYKASLLAFNEPTRDLVEYASRFYRNILASLNMLEESVFDVEIEPKFDVDRNLGVFNLSDSLRGTVLTLGRVGGM